MDIIAEINASTAADIEAGAGLEKLTKRQLVELINDKNRLLSEAVGALKYCESEHMHRRSHA